MMYADHNRAWKPVQRTFRDVEEAYYAQQMARKYPKDQENIKTARSRISDATTAVNDANSKVDKNWLKQQDVDKAQLDASYQAMKAEYDSQQSLKNILVDDRDKAAADSSYRKKLEDQVKEKKDLLAKMETDLAAIQTKQSQNERAVAEAQDKVTKAKQDLSDAQDNLKKLTDDFDRTAKLATQKAWKAGDAFRAWPIIDGFASPYKIQQVTLNDLTIDYGGFKDVPRYDRCGTCHLAIDKANFTQPALAALNPQGDDKTTLQENYVNAYQFLHQQQENKEIAGFDPDDLPSKRTIPVGVIVWVLLGLTLAGAIAVGYLKGAGGPIGLTLAGGLVLTVIIGGTLAVVSPRERALPTIDLKPAQISQYAAHPRLDLFVDANSPHPVEKFGCTICHAGQGSGTEFSYAAHTPDNARQAEVWEKEHSWEPTHDWEFPMLPKRFVESGCIKCHHQVTDLVRYGSQEEAPKLLKGYNLVRENGCFGCHEISGRKGDKEVGPDLRLEPVPPLENMPADERAKILADVNNPPGTLRKVGPSLRRISEKTNEDWVRKWINSPRGFRPDTRMPHFFNLSNNDPTLKDADGKPVLPKDQEQFPSTEISCIAHYLLGESRAFLHGTDKFKHDNEARRDELQAKAKNHQATAKELIEIEEINRRLELWKAPKPLSDEHIVDADFKDLPSDQIPPSSDKEEDRNAGKALFTERGCLACHSHSGVDKSIVDDHENAAHFGPNLSLLAAKIVVHDAQGKPDAAASRRWVIQWVLNPNVHFSRTRMPIMHLNPTEAAHIADWLLSQPVKDKEYEEWNKQEMPAPTPETLKDLARVYLKKAPGVNPLDVDSILEHGIPKQPAGVVDPIAKDADEHIIDKEGDQKLSTEKLMTYIGKKAINRLGCFACHDVPGFEYSKPIGTPLNDWGKKDPARIAFEDIDAYVDEHYKIVETRNDKDNNPSEDWKTTVNDGKKPYEKFFDDALKSRHREGFLHQKLQEPRSYDFHRDLKWDDRLRMPQFQFAHPAQNKGESDEDFKARASMEEAEAREAVMTFILGLVAEPIHGRYQSNPNVDRLAEVKGRQVLDKFNCTGCHLVRSGVYDFKLDDASRALLERNYNAAKNGTYDSDYMGQDDFKSHNAWVGLQSLAADHLMVQGVDPRVSKTQTSAGGEALLLVRLTDAAQFIAPKAGKPATIAAHEDVSIDPATMISRSDPYGGHFADLLVKAHYLQKSDSAKYTSEDDARSALPPPLLREGEKVQPEWLYTFLRNPSPIRPVTVGSKPGTVDGKPAVIGGLRMPKFNMSEDEAASPGQLLRRGRQDQQSRHRPDLSLSEGARAR